MITTQEEPIWFAQTLSLWYQQNKRDLPFRHTEDPYKIFVSEIMLQQTQIKTVVPYYERFIQRFPDVLTLAKSPIEDVLSHWEGLGYYRRAKHLHESAQTICHRFFGEFPSQLKDIKALKGVGRYTAAALHSIAFNQPSPAVDGNVMRVLSRFIGYDEPIDKQTSITFMENWLKKVIVHSIPKDFTQAMMELGALTCTKHPQCHACPLHGRCYAFNHLQTERLPVKKKTLQKVEIAYHVIVANDEKGRVILQKRPPTGLLADLYEFPQYDDATLEQSIERFLNDYRITIGETQHIDTVKHVFSHRIWRMKIYKVSIETNCNDAPLYALNKLPGAMSRAHLKIIELLKK